MKKNKVFIFAIIAFVIIISILVINQLTKPKEGELIQITYEEVSKKIKKEEDFVLVVSQSTCSHCATYKPKLTTIAKEQGIDLYYIDYDLEENKEEFLKEYNLNGATPTTIFIKNGKETSLMDRLEGDLSSSTVIEKLKKLGFIEK